MYSDEFSTLLELIFNAFGEKNLLLNVRTMYGQCQNYLIFGLIKVKTTYSQGQNYLFSEKICGKLFAESFHKGQNYLLLKVRTMYFGLFLKVRTMYLKVRTMYFNRLMLEGDGFLFAF